MGSIRNAFPGLSNPPNLAEFIGMHPSLPGSSISFGQFHGLTAVSPTFSFSNVSLSNGSVTASNGALVFSGNAGATTTFSCSFALSNYLNFSSYNAPISFALSNSVLPTGCTISTSGILSHYLRTAVSSSANVIATNRWGNFATIPLIYNINMASMYGVGSLAPGSSLSMVLSPHGTLYIAGDRYYGQLGDNYTGTSTSSIYTSVSSTIMTYGSIATLVSTGGHLVYATCGCAPAANAGPNTCMAIDNIGKLHAWGYNAFGNGSNQYIPSLVDTTSGISSLYGKSAVQVVISWLGTFILDSNGSLHKMVNGFPQLVNVVNGTSSLYNTIVSAIACGSQHVLAIDSTGILHAWGDNSSGQLGMGANDHTTRSYPNLVNYVNGVSSLYGKTVIAVAGGYSHTVAIDSTGLLHAWGLNNGGQLGMNNTTLLNVPNLVNTSNGVSSLYNKRLVAIACSTYCSIALDSTGSLHAWGQNNYGPLGTATQGGQINVPTLVNSSSGSSLYGKNVAAIACGDQHTLALDTSGLLHSWGWNMEGQLLNGTTNTQYTPILVNSYPSTAPSTFIANAGYSNISIGTTSSITFIVANGTLYCTGRESSGQLGDNCAYGSSNLRLIVNSDVTKYGSIAASISAGNHINCVAVGNGDNGGGFGMALDSAGALHSWGANFRTQLGNSSTYTSDSYISRRVMMDSPSSLFGKTVVAVACCVSLTIALDSNGALHMWGFIPGNSMNGGWYPGLVNAANGSSSLYGKTVSSIACGSAFCMALDSNGAIHSMGNNSYGALGVNNTNSSGNPQFVNTTSGVSSLFGKTCKAIACGSMHAAALDTTGIVHSWGWNALGQLGMNDYTNRLVPQLVNTTSGLSSLFGKVVVAIACGQNYSLALDSAGSLHAWGYNSSGNLGMGASDVTARLVPNLVNTTNGVSSLYDKIVVSISCGTESTFALDSNGALHSWGYNSYGNLLDGTVKSRTVPALTAQLR